ncbi:MAG: M23 family metallopeptidase [Clostridia bacterium]|nr:M23 family metallopeptidase [Clostridia bacterium]
MSDTGTLRIHAQVRPAQAGAERGAEKPPIQIVAKPRKGRGKIKKPRPKLTQADRLLRNSAYACALLLGVLALGNVDQPWAKKASDSVEQALTMRINLDESTGALRFVRNLMPESALVFMNLSGGTALMRPVDGPLAHAWSETQPWVMFNCADGTPVVAAAAGTVTAVSPMSEGTVGVLVDHGEGVETLYAHLTEASVSPGDAVARGQALGTGGDGVYFEYRQGGESLDPAAALGL